MRWMWEMWEIIWCKVSYQRPVLSTRRYMLIITFTFIRGVFFKNNYHWPISDLSHPPNPLRSIRLWLQNDIWYRSIDPWDSYPWAALAFGSLIIRCYQFLNVSYAIQGDLAGIWEWGGWAEAQGVAKTLWRNGGQSCSEIRDNAVPENGNL